jgi:hypothetical protein
MSRLSLLRKRLLTIRKREVCQKVKAGIMRAGLVGFKGGEVNTVDPTMERLLGRKPRGIEEAVDQLFGAAKVEVDTKELMVAK